MDEISHTVKNHSKLKITKNNNLKKWNGVFATNSNF